jgi:hypothetical protein
MSHKEVWMLTCRAPRHLAPLPKVQMKKMATRRISPRRLLPVLTLVPAQSSPYPDEASLALKLLYSRMRRRTAPRLPVLEFLNLDRASLPTHVFVGS